jgi:hypothetical protein
MLRLEPAAAMECRQQGRNHSLAVVAIVSLRKFRRKCLTKVIPLTCWLEM